MFDKKQQYILFIDILLASKEEDIKKWHKGTEHFKNTVPVRLPVLSCTVLGVGFS